MAEALEAEHMRGETAQGAFPWEVGRPTFPWGPMSREYETRLQEHAQSNQDSEGRGVAELIVDTGERLTALCLHEEVVAEAMIGLHRNFGLPDFPSHYSGERSWPAL
jgi:hypothetical protein